MSLQQLVDGLNALGIGPRDLIAILQAIKAAGAHPGRNRGDVMTALLRSRATPAANAALAAAIRNPPQTRPHKARAAAQDFEAVFLNSMFQQMFADVGEGPFGGGPAPPSGARS